MKEKRDLTLEALERDLLVAEKVSPPPSHCEAFGGLPLVPEHRRQPIRVYREDCYICRDLDYMDYLFATNVPNAKVT